jgi:multiple antibiotic resistance protein
MVHWGEYAKVLVAILVIVDPIGIIPVFLTLTSGRTAAERRRVARVAAVGMTAVLIASALAGDYVLRGFGIGIPSFRVGAGIILLLMAIAMLHARLGATRQAPEEAEEAEEKDAVAMVPMAIPLLAGPGAISTVIVYSHQDKLGPHAAGLCAIIVSVGIIVWVALRLAAPIARLLGTTGIKIANRLMGLILAAIAVELMADGLKGLFPGLR